MTLPIAHLEGLFVGSRGKPVPVWRQVNFAIGLPLMAVVLVTPLSDVADELVIGHMIEHLIIGDIASLFIVVGLTGPILQPILATPPFDKLRVLAHPLVALPLLAVNFYIWHVPAFYDAAYGGTPVHALEHGLFIAFGCLMWMPIFGPLPKPTWFTAGWKVVESGVELDPAGAQRAVAAGQSERLERQLIWSGGKPGAGGTASG